MKIRKFKTKLTKRKKIIFLLALIFIILVGTGLYIFRDKILADENPSSCNIDNRFDLTVKSIFTNDGKTPLYGQTGFDRAYSQTIAELQKRANTGLLLPSAVANRISTGQKLTRGDMDSIITYNLMYVSKPITDYLKMIVTPQATTLLNKVNSFQYMKGQNSVGLDPTIEGFDTKQSLFSKDIKINASLSGTKLSEIRATFNLKSSADIAKTFTAQYSTCDKKSLISASDRAGISFTGDYKIYQGTSLIGNYNASYNITDGSLSFFASKSF